MAYSGIVKDADLGIKPAGQYPRRVIMFTLLSLIIGWSFTTYMPQIPDMALRVGLGLLMAVGLLFMTTAVSQDRGQRTFCGIVFGLAFIAGMWGLWVWTEFGAIPTVDQVKAVASGESYALQVFGEPIAVQGLVFEFWISMTLIMASVPLLAGLAKPPASGVRANPFAVHSDFAQSAGARAIMLPLLGFAIAAAAVYVFPYLANYSIPVEVACLPPLIAGFLYAKLHMSFPRALTVSLIGGIAAAAGFWLPWMFQTYGQEGMLEMIANSPQWLIAWAQGLAGEYAYATDAFGITVDYSPWTFEIWAGLTLAYFAMPLIVTLCRRFIYLMRAA